MDSLIYLVPLVPLALFLGFRYPQVCCAFLIAGATSYFAATEWLHIPWSTEFTATVYATASVAAVGGLLAKKPLAIRRLRGPVPVLAIVYIAFWTWRRILEPPVRPGVDAAPYTMIIYGLFGFLPGLLVTDEEVWHSILDWTAIFGLMTTAILLFHWAIGTTGDEPDRWLPVRNITGILISLELGVGFLALRHSLDRRRWPVWVSWAMLLVTLALMSKLAERGPLVFLVLAVGLDSFLRGRGASLRQFMFVAVALGVVVLGLYISTEIAPTRATDAANYDVESNTIRFEILSSGFTAFSERPFWGWGGSLVGRNVDGGEWWYVHCTYLDPFIDTGLVGALVFWSMLILLVAGIWQNWTRLGGRSGIAASALPLYLLVALEGQVSGTVWSTRHLWFVTGVLSQLIPLRGMRSQSLAPGGAAISAWRTRKDDGL
jgi:hypothetical protein